MPALSRRDVLAMLLAAPVAARSFAHASDLDDSTPWLTLFDGKSLNGWKASEHEGTFSLVDGEGGGRVIQVHGMRSHLFYTGPLHHADFKNFEFSADVLTHPRANSGIYFHTAFQPTGFPSAGFEVQVANTFPGDNKKTGSLYSVRNVYKQLVNDNEWFNVNIQVRAKQVQIRLNNMLVVDYIEPAEPFRADTNFQRALNHGTFALQGHDPGSTTFFKNIRVRPLPDTLSTPAADLPVVDDLYRQTMLLGEENYPVVDYHVHLKGGLTLDQALANSRRLGIGYGIAINCGLNFPVHDDQSVHDYLATMKGQPCYVALQGEGREWMTLTSPESVARFDYCFTDAMTFRDDSGYRRRLYVPEEMGDLSNPEAFIEMYVNRIEAVLHEPIDIYVNPTYLPLPIRPQYDALWTPARMKRVIDAAIENDVAIEINNRYKIPSPAFIKAAKAAGAKFSFGTNNAEAEIGRLEYPIQMVAECGLKWQDIFVPKPDGQKPIQVKKWRMTPS
ncbi:MAG TPA: family 16 glycoside hydrolase [Terracidiphilus sp.]|nr:family 16 glycoside hydrolase [Terracidiphilus sp.]